MKIPPTINEETSSKSLALLFYRLKLTFTIFFVNREKIMR